MGGCLGGIMVVHVSTLNLNFPSFPNVPCCITIPHDPLQFSRNATSNSPPSFAFIPNDPHNINNPHNLCLISYLGYIGTSWEYYPGHPDPL